MNRAMATRLSDRARRRYRKQREKQRAEKNRKKAINRFFSRLRLLREERKRRKAQKKRQKSDKRMRRLLKKTAPKGYFLTRDRLEKAILMLIVWGLLGLFIGLNQTFAVSLGTQGAIYPIVEPDLLAGITQTLQLKIDNGEWADWQREWQLRTQARSERPDPVAGVSDLPAEKSPRVWLFDPTMTVNRDITIMRSGRKVVLAAKGQRLNPLTVWPLDKTLLFINGDNLAQLAWLKSILHKAQRQKAINTITIILVRGNVKTTASTLQHRVYFDQFGALCQRFGITHTPTRIFQAKRNGQVLPHLQIEEISVE